MNITDIVNTRAALNRYPLSAFLAEIGPHFTSLNQAASKVVELAEKGEFDVVFSEAKSRWYVENTDEDFVLEKRIKDLPQPQPIRVRPRVLGSRFNTFGGSEDVLQRLNAIPLDINLPFYNSVEHTREGDKNFDQFLEVRELVIQTLSYPFYLEHTPDKRGRFYTKGFYIDYQGDSYSKALVDFAYPEKITERGRYWLHVDACNRSDTPIAKWDHDKKQTVSREELEIIQYSGRDWKEKPQFLKSMLVQDDLYTGHPVGQDAGASGLQIMSVLTNDVEGCRITGLTGAMSDAYQVMIDGINALGYSYTRGEGKAALMP